MAPGTSSTHPPNHSRGAASFATITSAGDRTGLVGIPAIRQVAGAPGVASATFPLTGLARAALEILWFGGGTLALSTGLTASAAVFFALFVLNAVLRIVWKQV
ncbi:hypothetical protein [Nonomuraea sp. NPDC049625]|uniref:hypothetical protein n=1 Tax=Nonomuraea sp. NPDC049625 TaxID=3155775 RepID=UPI00341A3423